MKEISKESVVKFVGIDLAKRSFHLHAVDAKGRQIASKTLSRARFSAFGATPPPCTVAMEACGSAYDWARLFCAYGHEVRLIAPQFVKPYVKTNKHDAADAEVICEAAGRPNMRFVPIKEVEQQAVLTLHRARSLLVAERTALVNHIRDLLSEYGVVMARGVAEVRAGLRCSIRAGSGFSRSSCSPTSCASSS